MLVEQCILGRLIQSAADIEVVLLLKLLDCGRKLACFIIVQFTTLKAQIHQPLFGTAYLGDRIQST